MKIAICDDMEMFLSGLHIILDDFFEKKKMDIEVDEFISGEDLLFGFSSGKYDIIILDIEMKTLNGIETAKAIRKLDDTVIIAYHTSHSDVYSEYDIGSYLLMKKGQVLMQYYDQLDELLNASKKRSRI